MIFCTKSAFGFNFERHCLTVTYARLRISHRVGGNRKHYQQSMNGDQKSIETVFLIAICRQCGDMAIKNTVSIDF